MKILKEQKRQDTVSRDEEYLESFGECVRKRRKKLHLTQTNLAVLMNVHRTYIGDIEKGRRHFTIKILQRLAQALDLSVSTLTASVEKSNKG